MKRQKWIIFWLLGLFCVSCSVINPPLLPTIPAPLVTPLTLDDLHRGSNSGDSLPVSFSGEIQPQRDPDIVALLNNVSQQQLIAYVQQLESFGTRNSFSDTERTDWGIGAARRWIASEFERVGGGRLQVTLQEFPLAYQGLNSTQQNVVAILPGNSPYKGVFVIGAHYDSRIGDNPVDGTSRSPSANDNASGVAMILELARLMSSRTWNQTVVFVAFSSEEQETAGSRRFVTNAILEGWQIDGAISNDGIGGRAGIPQLLRLFSPDIETSSSGRLARYITFLSQMYLPEFPIELENMIDREGRYGDHREFIAAGIPAVRFIESQEDPSLLNSPADTWEKIDYNYLMQICKINLVVLANWAGSPTPLQQPTVSNMAESGSYLVVWPVDLQATGYAISFRPINQLIYSNLRYIPANQAGSVAFNGLDPSMTYGVSIAPLSQSGRLGGFSAEVLIP